MRTEGAVERAVRQALGSGCTLLTPGRGYPPSNQKRFAIIAMNGEGIGIDRDVPSITWRGLEQVVLDVRNQGSPVRIGAVHGIPEPDTLEAYLMDALDTQTSTASYAASILESVGIVEYAKIADIQAMHIRLLPPYTTDLPTAVPPMSRSDGG